jgi:hypothetical protein
MRTRQDIESYLIRSGLPYDEVGEGMWVVHDRATGENVVVSMADTLVLFRLKMFELANLTRKEHAFKKLLELNAADMVHGSYGIADGSVVLTCSLRLENLDYNEFQGTLDDFSLALTNHYESLKPFRVAE